VREIGNTSNPTAQSGEGRRRAPLGGARQMGRALACRLAQPRGPSSQTEQRGGHRCHVPALGGKGSVRVMKRLLALAGVTVPLLLFGPAGAADVLSESARPVPRQPWRQRVSTDYFSPYFSTC